MKNKLNLIIALVISLSSIGITAQTKKKTPVYTTSKPEQQPKQLILKKEFLLK
jgi:hypothetical protein